MAEGERTPSGDSATNSSKLQGWSRGQLKRTRVERQLSRHNQLGECGLEKDSAVRPAHNGRISSVSCSAIVLLSSIDTPPLSRTRRHPIPAQYFQLRLPCDFAHFPQLLSSRQHEAAARVVCIVSILTISQSNIKDVRMRSF